jgi:putative redox protein
VRDAMGNHLTGITLDFAIDFPDTDGGAAAEAVLERAIQMSHDRLCTVTRTVELPTAVQPRLRGADATSPASSRAS